MGKIANITKEHLIIQAQGNIVSDMDGEKVMLSIQNGKYYNLGELGGEIWELVKEPISIQSMVARLQAQYIVDQTECEEQVIIFLGQLLDEGLIQIKDQNHS